MGGKIYLLFMMAIALCSANPFPGNHMKRSANENPFQMRKDTCIDLNTYKPAKYLQLVPKELADMAKKLPKTLFKVTESNKTPGGNSIVTFTRAALKRSTDNNNLVMVISGMLAGTCSQKINLALMNIAGSICTKLDFHPICKYHMSHIIQANPDSIEKNVKDPAKRVIKNSQKIGECVGINIDRNFKAGFKINNTCDVEFPGTKALQAFEANYIYEQLKGNKTCGLIYIIDGDSKEHQILHAFAGKKDKLPKAAMDLHRTKAKMASSYLTGYKKTSSYGPYALKHKMAHGTLVDTYFTEHEDKYSFVFRCGNDENMNADEIAKSIMNLVTNHVPTKSIVVKAPENVIAKAFEYVRQQPLGEFVCKTLLSYALEHTSRTQQIKADVKVAPGGGQVSDGYIVKTAVYRPFLEEKSKKSHGKKHAKVVIIGGQELTITMMASIVTVKVGSPLRQMVYETIPDPNPSMGNGVTKNGMVSTKKSCNGMDGIYYMGGFTTGFKKNDDPCHPKYTGDKPNLALETQVIDGFTSDLKNIKVVINIVYDGESCLKPTLFFTKDSLKDAMDEFKKGFADVEIKKGEHSGNFVSHFTDKHKDAAVFTICAPKKAKGTLGQMAMNIQKGIEKMLPKVTKT